MKKDVYLDGAADTKLDPAVLAAMLPYMTNGYVGNSRSIHPFGVRSAQAVQEARETVAKIVGVEASGVYFCSGATEANNWVIKGLAFHEKFDRDGLRRNTIALLETEHSSVRNVCEQLRDQMGFRLIWIPSTPSGDMSPQVIADIAVDPDVFLICTMGVNNETGTIYPINELVKMLTSLGVDLNKKPILCDCTQAIECGGKDTELAKRYPGVSYFSFAGHKINGPEGIGCLIAANHSPVYPLIAGGDQEDGKRGGTSNVPGIVGLAKALEILHDDTELECRYEELYVEFMKDLEYYNQTFGTDIYPTFDIPYDRQQKNIISLDCSSVGKYDDFSSVLATDGIAVSAGSACHAGEISSDGKPTPSHVLTALGVPANKTSGIIRISFTKNTTSEDLLDLFDAIKSHLKKGNA